MTDEKINIFQRQLINLKKRLADLEIKRQEGLPKEGSPIWQKFVDITIKMDKIEQAISRINREIISDINQSRAKICELLDQYNHWRQNMREMEKLFVITILRPGFTLKQAKRQRTYLQNAYDRMKKGIENKAYDSIHDLEADIRSVLIHGEEAYKDDQASFQDEQIDEKIAWSEIENLQTEDIVEEIDQDQLVIDFKRVVLPAVHPDTSDAPPETFRTAFEAYEARDYLLMEAYVAQYQGQIDIDEDQEPSEVYDHLSEKQRRYHRLSERLTRRLGALKKELSQKEIDDPEEIKKTLKEQSKEIRHLIQNEIQRILDIREMIQNLVELFIKLN